MNLEALIPIVCGALIILVGNGTLPKNPKDPQKLDEWRRKYGKIIKVLGPTVVVLGVLQLIGAF
jgi:hypothetical protein